MFGQARGSYLQEVPCQPETTDRGAEMTGLIAGVLAISLGICAIILAYMEYREIKRSAAESVLSVAPEFSWHEVGCVKRYGAVSTELCACEKRCAPNSDS